MFTSSSVSMRIESFAERAISERESSERLTCSTMLDWPGAQPHIADQDVARLSRTRRTPCARRARAGRRPSSQAASRSSGRSSRRARCRCCRRSKPTRFRPASLQPQTRTACHAEARRDRETASSAAACRRSTGPRTRGTSASWDRRCARRCAGGTRGRRRPERFPSAGIVRAEILPTEQPYTGPAAAAP